MRCPCRMGPLCPGRGASRSRSRGAACAGPPTPLFLVIAVTWAEHGMPSRAVFRCAVHSVALNTVSPLHKCHCHATPEHLGPAELELGAHWTPGLPSPLFPVPGTRRSPFCPWGLPQVRPCRGLCENLIALQAQIEFYCVCRACSVSPPTETGTRAAPPWGCAQPRGWERGAQWSARVPAAGALGSVPGGGPAGRRACRAASPLPVHF